jgi:hypothetical protein
MALRRCWLPKESSRIDETIDNRVVRRMAVLVLFPHSGSMSTKVAMRQMMRFSMVSSNWDDSLGIEHLQSDI